MAHKDFRLIPSPLSCFVQLAKLIRGDSLFGKISLGINFPLCYMPFYMKTLQKTIFLLILSFISCDGQTNKNPKNQDKKNISNYQNEILSEDEMRVTTDKAISLIQNKNYYEFKQLIVEDISKNISEQQIIQIVDQINQVLKSEGVPTGNDNILPSLKATLSGKDTIFVNNIIYNFKPISNVGNFSQKVLTFSFLKKYGTNKIVGVSLNTNPLSSANVKPNITQMQIFDFNVSDITNFRIYYDEGEDRKTQYKNEIGYFAIQGDINTLQESGILPKIEIIFSELKKSKYKSVATFNSTLNRGENAKYIQAEFGFKNLPYSLFIYLPIKNGGKYADEIIVMQREYANLGYAFTLNQEFYPKIKSELPKIAEMKLEKFYLDKP